MTKSISLLGSTGSIGKQTLDICMERGIRVEALTAHSNIDLLEQQARQFKPRLAVLFEERAALESLLVPTFAPPTSASPPPPKNSAFVSARPTFSTKSAPTPTFYASSRTRFRTAFSDNSPSRS